MFQTLSCNGFLNLWTLNWNKNSETFSHLFIHPRINQHKLLSFRTSKSETLQHRNTVTNGMIIEDENRQNYLWNHDYC